MIWLPVFRKKSYEWVFVDTSCFDEVILAELGIPGSQFMAKFDLILSSSNRFDFLVFTFLYYGFFFKIILNQWKQVLSDE